MKNGFIKILALTVIIICGVWYIIGHTTLKLDNVNYKESKADLTEKEKLVNEKDKFVDGNNINVGEELILVNSENGLNKNYKPKDLTVPNIVFVNGVNQEEKQVAGIIVKPLEELIKSAKGEGIVLLGNSGYRSYKSQENTYKNRVKSEGEALANAYVAKPGFSEHQTGLCIDIANESRLFIKGTKEADWLAKNCYKFGFIIRYPYGKKSITGIEYEPWHIRYVGKKAAKYIYDNGITLEEYLKK